jgi:hypothetical protein
MFLSFYFLNNYRNMKKIMFMLIVAVIAYGFMQFSQPNQELIDAKKELWIQTDNSTDSQINEAKKEIFKQVDNAVWDIKEVIEDVVKEETPIFTTELLSGADILELDKLKISDLSDGEVDLTWKINAHVDTIRVLYTNSNSDYPDDDYSLQQFVAGSDKFLYRAYSGYKTFDFGTNIYTIIMTSWKEESRVQLSIYYPNLEEGENSNQENVKIEEVNHSIDSSDLPTSGDYGSPVKLWENKFSYSDIKGFQVEKHSVSMVDCNSDLVTSTIWEKTWSWSWWNTCRPSTDKDYVTYYALNMKDGEYVYAKHYFSPKYYAITELSTGIDEWWNTLETVSDKNEWLKNNNNELKEQNENFELTKITDTLFENIIKN